MEKIGAQGFLLAERENREREREREKRQGNSTLKHGQITLEEYTVRS